MIEPDSAVQFNGASLIACPGVAESKFSDQMTWDCAAVATSESKPVSATRRNRVCIESMVFSSIELRGSMRNSRRAAQTLRFRPGGDESPPMRFATPGNPIIRSRRVALTAAPEDGRRKAPSVDHELDAARQLLPSGIS